MTLSVSEMNRLKRRSYYVGVGIFLFDVVVYSLSILGTVAAPALSQRIACSCIAGFWSVLLFIVAHDACHQSLTPNRWLNRMIGTMAFIPSLHNYSLWHYGHNLVHHLHTNVLGKDPSWAPLSLNEYRSLGLWSRMWYRFFRTFPGHFFYYPLELWWQRYFCPRRQYVDRMHSYYRVDFALCCCWLVTICSAAIIGRSFATNLPVAEPRNWVEPLLLSFVTPFLLSHWVFSSSIYLHHCHPRAHWYSESTSGKFADLQRRSAIHVQFPGFLDWLLHWIMEHTAHHMQPSIPSYQLREAQRLIESRSGTYVIKYPWRLSTMFRILRQCKLYDDVAGCWTDYSGRPTSDSRRSELVSIGNWKPNADLIERDKAA